MSYVATEAVLKKKVGSPTRKAVLLYMAGCASDDGSGVWASKKTIAADLEMGKRTVQKCIEDLVGAGLIAHVGKRPCANGYTIEYRLNLNAISTLEPTRALAARMQKEHLTRARDAGQEVQEVPPNIPRTLSEPSEEPPLVPREQKSTRATSLPDSWVPSKKNVQDAADRSFTEKEIEYEADRFRDYHLAKGTKFKDWDAGWRTWLSNSRKFGNQRMAFTPDTSRRRHGSGVASVVARRRAERSV
ncbi:hypothetical protein GS639_07200 [Ruegeria sp. HKCCD4332]|nr:hypothetical protein [Ruegeria sp. HKCCD4332]